MSFINRFLALFLVLFSTASLAQEPRFFVELSGGYARAEDGIPTVALTDLQQMSPSLKVAAGYCFSKHFSVAAQYLAIAQMKATGVVRSTNQAVELRPSFSALAFDLIVTMPIERFSVEVFAGPAYLRQRLVRRAQNQSERTVNTGNVGFHAATGVRYQFTERVSTALRFDFINPFGDAEHWEGDAGVLNAALRYSLATSNTR